ncbi:MAG: hypothetical protein EOP11_23765 [Proteobacteria bacterium]|nr:MAG: hypothetical protein EOP11_23765 [Pseudomonadota bacterium]
MILGMKDFATLNPILRFDTPPLSAGALAEPVTIGGIINKAFILLALCTVAVFAFWDLVSRNIVGNVLQHGLGWWFFFSPFVLLLVLVLMVGKPAWGKFLAPLGALCLGIIGGFLSGLAQLGNMGEIIYRAIFSTLLAFAFLLTAYKLRWITVGRSFVYNFARFLLLQPLFFVANIARAYAFASYRGQLFTMDMMQLILGVLVGLLAACVVLIDLSLIEDSLEAKAPKAMEWHLGFALLFDLVWMYVTILLVFAMKKKRD